MSPLTRSLRVRALGRPIQVLEYKGSPEHMQRVAELAEQMAYAFDDDSGSEDESKDVEDLTDAHPTPGEYLFSDASA
jgi:hypothetical protein